MKKIKLFITLIIMLLLVVSLNNISNAAQDYGTVTAITGSPSIDSNDSETVTLTYSSLNVEWAKQEGDRNKNGWWIGIKVTAPDNANKDTATIKRKQYGEDWIEGIKFNDKKDGESEINLWAYIDDTILTSNKNKTFDLYEAQFDWGNGKTQTIKIKIDASEANFGNLQLNTSSSMSKVFVVDLGTGAAARESNFTIERGKTLEEGLSASEKDIFNSYKAIKGFVRFYKFTGPGYTFEADKVSDYEANKFDPDKDAINEENVVIVAYINNVAPVLTPTESAPAPVASAPDAAPAPAGEKDNTPKTGVTDIVGYVVTITVFSAMGIVVLINKSKKY